MLNAFLSQLGDQHHLTFTDFEVTNGPALEVYAVKVDTTENESVKDAVGNGDFISLGELKGNIGNQNYVLETKLDPKEYQVISIWCQRFGRNFGSARLGGTKKWCNVNKVKWVYLKLDLDIQSKLFFKIEEQLRSSGIQYILSSVDAKRDGVITLNHISGAPTMPTIPK